MEQTEQTFKENQLIELPVDSILEVIAVLDNVLENEVKTDTEFKYKFIEPETGKEVSKPTPKQIENKKLQKIVDIERTIYDPSLRYSITEKGLKITRLKYFLEGNLRKLAIENSKETSDTEESES